MDCFQLIYYPDLTIEQILLLAFLNFNEFPY